LADFANEFVDVAGWLSVFPSFNSGVRLKKPLAVIFPDSIPKVFHEFSNLAWGHNGNHSVWESYVREMLDRADRVVAFSKHVRDHQLSAIFGVDPSKVIIVPHASPDLAPMLPFVSNRRRTVETVAAAAAMLRDHVSERGWNYLANYPFDQVPFIAVSTQDRVTKNIRLILDSVLRLIREQRCDLKILATAPLHFGADWTVLPSAIEHRQAHRDFISMPDLPREEHAALFHCAAVAVHASIFEGGHAPFPFYEAVSVGTPCLMARGPHTEELLESAPELERFLFDPNDAGALARLIVETCTNRNEALAIQQGAYNRLQRRSWSDVSLAYAEAAVLGPVNRTSRHQEIH
jgi:glycosyltransferase involved in cell wall biosynthesis